MNKFPLSFPAVLAAFSWLSVSGASAAPRQMEALTRGVVAVRQADDHVFVGWRLFGNDPEAIAFNVYRQSGDAEATKLNGQPISRVTFFVDTSADLDRANAYFVRPVLDGREGDPSGRFVLPAHAPARQYLEVPLRTPEGYQPNDASVGDLDGDGEYEIVLHQAGRGQDNSRPGLTDPPILQAYEMDGTMLWEINLGKNIREGAHYTQFMVYDLDGDGRAEVACKTADGTTDGQGRVIGDATADYRNDDGFILAGPEFLTVFDGRTGAALDTVDYIPPRGGNGSGWGDSKGNRVDRFLACVAYLDGEHPSLVMCRGYYTRAVLAAWDFKDGHLVSRWVFDSDSSDENRKYRGQGNHNLSVADVDGDRRDEIVYGAAVIDDDGTGLYSTGWGHGDALHVGDLVPDNPGLEVFDIQERFDDEGMSMRDAKTGRPIFLIPAVRAAESGGDKGEGPGRGNSFNIDPRHPGAESWARGAGMTGLYDAHGERISETGPRSCNFAVWWDGDVLRELLDRNWIGKWNWRTEHTDILLTATECRSNNGTKATPALSADLFGDWREEVMWRTSDGSALHIYTTTIPTEVRMPTLMHYPQYRLSIAWQNVAYNQPPHLGHYLDPAAPLPPRPEIRPVMAQR